MKYKIALLAILFLGCSKIEPEPEYILKSDREIELEEKIEEEINKNSVIRNSHNPENPRTRQMFEQLYKQLKEARHCGSEKSDSGNLNSH